MLLAVMLASLIMSSFLPEAFDGRSLAFAAALVAIQVGGRRSRCSSLGAAIACPVIQRALV